MSSYYTNQLRPTLRPGPTLTPSGSNSRVLSFTTHHHLRHRLILSLLSRRPIRITQIRPTSSTPGLVECEISFLRLLEKITEGTKVEISYTGTALLFHPGTIAGGVFNHTCTASKSVGWFLEPLLAIAPFGKKDLVLTLRGVTTDGRDVSVDTLRTAALPHLAMFLEKEGLELRVRWHEALSMVSSLELIVVGGDRLRREGIHHWEEERSLSLVRQCEPSNPDSTLPP